VRGGGPRRPTGSAAQVQENYHTHTGVEVQDQGSAAYAAQVADRSGVPSVSETSVETQAPRHQVLHVQQLAYC